jgi:uncharacterized protein (TIGR02246 family)
VRDEGSALEVRLRALEDREAIRDLIASYGPAVDSGDSDRAAALWHENGRYDVGGFGVKTGRDAIAALLEGETHQALIVSGAAHVLSPLRITLDGDRAIATGYSCVFRWTGTAFEAHRISANRWTLKRGHHGWRVEERVNRLLDGDAAARALLR